MTLNHSLGPEQPGLLIAHYGGTLIVEDQEKQLFRCHARQNLEPIATGDNVIWQAIDDETGVITACLPRRSVIVRPDKRTTTKPIAANVDQILIVIAYEPLPQPTTLDRYLILAESLNLNALLVMNKADLSETMPSIPWLNAYQALGYPWIEVSSKTGQGLSTLQSFLKDQTSILVGQSGVGKSSVLSSLIPEAKVQVRALSLQSGLGQHTTTASYLYHLETGGNMIDSPGIRQFKLNHLERSSIIQGFKEFRPFLGKCKFRNCAHQQEPGCALLTALKQNLISPIRFQNYHALMTDLAAD